MRISTKESHSREACSPCRGETLQRHRSLGCRSWWTLSDIFAWQKIIFFLLFVFCSVFVVDWIKGNHILCSISQNNCLFSEGPTLSHHRCQWEQWSPWGRRGHSWWRRRTRRRAPRSPRCSGPRPAGSSKPRTLTQSPEGEEEDAIWSNGFTNETILKGGIKVISKVLAFGCSDGSNTKEKCWIAVISSKMPQQVGSNHGHGDTSYCKIAQIACWPFKKSSPWPL